MAEAWEHVVARMEHRVGHVAGRESGRQAGVLAALTVAAITLRLFLLLGRGQYVAFDEGWYLLLGRNLWSGAGYTLSGLQHVALSPVFPILAGALDVLIDDMVWAGRMVAAVAAGLLVVPCWYIFDRLAGRSIAIIGCVFVALMPSLAPFVAPYWIGWDLWVGAEPLLHLFLFTGVALFLRTWQDRSAGAALGCGVAFALAYLARPEAIVTFGLLGLLAVVAAGRSLRARAVPMALCAVAFGLTATPYWSYLHEELGRWAITGRGIQVTPPPRTLTGGPGAASNRIEDMLWRNESTYVRSLYSLNASGTALANGYWGVRPIEADPPADPTPGAPREDEAPSPAAAVGDRERGEEVEAQPAAPTPPQTAPQLDASGEGDGILGSLGRYTRAMGIVVPWYLWLFVAIGVAAPFARGEERTPGETRRLRLEALVAAPIVGSSALIAVIVATDPRTQLFLAPLACFYAARGAVVAAGAVKARMGADVGRGFATGLVAGALALVLFATSARRLYLSLSVGSPHHIVAAENAVVGAALREATPPEATVMSWHPAIALFADRDWRVLPLEPMARIVRYARTQPTPFLVFSVYYPPELLQAEEPHYLVVSVPTETPLSERWRIEVAEGNDIYAFGRLRADS